MSDSNKLGWRDILIIVLITLLVIASLIGGIFFNKYKSASNQIVIWNDSLTTYKNKYNEEYIAKNTYILKAEQLEAYNKELYKEYKSLKDNPIVITKTKVVTQIDTIYTKTDSLWHNNDTILWAWSAKDSCWYKINGIASITKANKADVVINNLEIKSDITMDVVDDGNQLKVIAKSDNPYVNMDMQSVVIDPLNSPTIKNLNKKKRWGFGPYIGCGLNVGYDLVHNNVGVNVGASIGFSIHYDLIQW